MDVAAQVEPSSWVYLLVLQPGPAWPFPNPNTHESQYVPQSYLAQLITKDQIFSKLADNAVLQDNTYSL